MHDGPGRSRRWRQETVKELGDRLRREASLEPSAAKPADIKAHLGGENRLPSPVRNSRSWEAGARLSASESRGFRVSESQLVVPPFAELPERTAESVRNLPGLLHKLCRRSESSRLTRHIVRVGLAVSVAAPIVAAVFTWFGADAAAVANQLSGIGLGYWVNYVTDWLKRNPGADPTDEATVIGALSEMLLAALAITENLPDGDTAREARRHFAVLLADPDILGAIMTVAATDGKKLLAMRPDLPKGISVDDWLLEEVIEVLEDLADQPNMLAISLEQAYRSAAQVGEASPAHNYSARSHHQSAEAHQN